MFNSTPALCTHVLQLVHTLVLLVLCCWTNPAAGVPAATLLRGDPMMIESLDSSSPPPQQPWVASAAASLVGVAVLGAAIFGCVKSSSSSSADKKRIQELEELVATKDSVIADLRAKLASTIAHLLLPPSYATCFRAAVYYEPWGLVNLVLSRQQGMRLVAAAMKLRGLVAAVETELGNLLFDESLWMAPGENDRFQHFGASHGPPSYWPQRKGLSSDGRRTWEAVRQPLLDAAKAAQKQAKEVDTEVDNMSNVLFGLMAGGKDLATDSLAAAAAAFAKAAKSGGAKEAVVQKLPADLMEFDGRTDIEAADMADGTKATLQRAADYFSKNVDETWVDGMPVFTWKPGATKIDGVNLKDAILIQQLELNYTQNQTTIPLLFMYAQQMFLWDDFRAAVTAAFKDFTHPTSVAPLKACMRAMAKQNPDVGDYVGQPFPHAQYIKDLLRCAQRVDDHADMVDAWTLIQSTFNVRDLKDRRLTDLHDVVIIIEFKGVLAEIQLSYKAVNALKMFGHAAYDFTRLDLATNCFQFGTIFDQSWMIDRDLKGADRKEVTKCSVSLE